MAQRTKKALAAALRQRMEHTTLDKITVRDITDACEVNRQTFYYHFQDIYDLLGWIFETEAEKAIAGNKTYGTWQQGFLQVFRFVGENKAFTRNVYHSLGREHMERYLYRTVYDLLMGVVEEQAAGLSVQAEDKQFIADFYKYAFVGLMLEWIRTGMAKDPEAIVDRLDKLISGDIRKALLKCAK